MDNALIIDPFMSNQNAMLFMLIWYVWSYFFFSFSYVTWLIIKKKQIDFVIYNMKGITGITVDAH